MANMRAQRPEFVRETVDSSALGVVEKPLTPWEIIYNRGEVRKAFILVVLALLWQLYAVQLDNPLLFPTFTATVEAFWQGIVTGGLLNRSEEHTSELQSR